MLTRYILGVAYDLNPATMPSVLKITAAKLSPAAMAIIQERTRAGTALSNEDRSVIYNDPAVRLKSHHASLITGKPLYDDHRRPAGLILDAFVEGSKIFILAAATDPQLIADIDSGRKRGLSVGYSVLANGSDVDPHASIVFNEVSVCEEPFFPGCEIQVAAHKEAEYNTGVQAGSHSVISPSMADQQQQQQPQQPPSAVDSVHQFLQKPGLAHASVDDLQKAAAAPAPAAASVPSQEALRAYFEKTEREMRAKDEQIQRLTEQNKETDAIKAEHMKSMQPDRDHVLGLLKTFNPDGFTPAIEKRFREPFESIKTVADARYISDFARAFEGLAKDNTAASKSIEALQRENAELKKAVEQSRSQIELTASRNAGAPAQPATTGDMFQKNLIIDEMFGRKRNYQTSFNHPASSSSYVPYAPAQTVASVSINASAGGGVEPPNKVQRVEHSDPQLDSMLRALDACNETGMRIRKNQ